MNDRTTQALLTHQQELTKLSLENPLQLVENVAIAKALALVTIALELRQFMIVDVQETVSQAPSDGPVPQEM